MAGYGLVEALSSASPRRILRDSFMKSLIAEPRYMEHTSFRMEDNSRRRWQSLSLSGSRQVIEAKAASWGIARFSVSIRGNLIKNGLQSSSGFFPHQTLCLQRPTPTLRFDDTQHRESSPPCVLYRPLILPKSSRPLRSHASDRTACFDSCYLRGTRLRPQEPRVPQCPQPWDLSSVSEKLHHPRNQTRFVRLYHRWWWFGRPCPCLEVVGRWQDHRPRSRSRWYRR